MSFRTVVGLALAAATIGAVACARRFEAPWSKNPVSTITLTAVMAQGIWTDEEVTAANAWRRDFREAHPVLVRGRSARISLKSADVVHSFSIPELGVERTEVYPGRVTLVSITPARAGVFQYYCTTVCGEAHFRMRGFLRVVGGEAAPAAPVTPGASYWLTLRPPPGAGGLALGAWHFNQKGCVTCHGEAGRGGIPNPNSMNATVPELATLARRTFLFTPADVAAFRRVLTSGRQLDGIAEAPRVPLFAAVKRQYLGYRQLLREGRRSTKLSPDGARPPLDMPAWESRLSDPEIDLVLGYLLTLSEPSKSPAHRTSVDRKGEVP